MWQAKAKRDCSFGYICVKYLLCVINTIFLFIGLLIFIFGSAMHAIFNDFTRFFSPSIISPATVLLFIGFLIFVISILGFYGVVKENVYIIYAFSTLLFFLLFIQFLTIASVYVYQSDVKRILTYQINSTIPEYDINEDAKFAMDIMQTTLECCGSKSFEDWDNVINNTINGLDVPRSCCVQRDLNPKYLMLVANKKRNPKSVIENREIDYDSCRYIYRSGCIDTFFDLIYQRSLLISFTVTTLVILEMAILGLTCVFAKAIQCQNQKKKSKNPVLLNSAEWLDKAAQAQFYDSQIENLNCLTDT